MNIYGAGCRKSRATLALPPDLTAIHLVSLDFVPGIRRRRILHKKKDSLDFPLKSCQK
jgi:hypothetical protein